jgi:DNA-binding transcriptional LysR family regulator
VYRNIDIALLRTFTVVAETGGMTKAGQVLNLTQAAVSQQIKRLEGQFQKRFIDRNRHSLRLTPDGERLHAHAQRLVSLNDEVWGLLTAPEFEGELRIGVPHDIVRALMPPILRDFSQTWPRVRIKLLPGTSLALLDALDRGAIDLTLTTETGCQAHGETLLSDQLVWVGARNGRSYTQDPLPISVAGASRTFRKAATDALARIKRDWRLVCEDRNMLVFYAMLEADLTVAPMLTYTVPSSLQLLDKDCGLPNLPTFNINIYAPKASIDELTSELARYVREQFVTRYRRVA